MQVETKLTGDLEADLARFEKKVQEEVLMAGVAATANVVYQEVRLNASRSKKSGKLYDAIYRVFSEDRSNETRKTYHVSWNHSKAPHGQLMEYGHFQRYQVVLTDSGDWITLKNRPITPKWIPPEPFIRPAFDHVGRAMEVGKAAMAEKLK